MLEKNSKILNIGMGLGVLIAGSLLCGHANAMSIKDNVKQSYVEFSGITINDSLDIRHMKKSKWAPEFKTGFELKDGLFADASTDLLSKDKLGFLADFGFVYKTGILYPYIAVYYDKNPTYKYSSQHEDLGYEVGLQVNLHNKIKPWVQGDDVVSLKKARLRVGAEIDLNKKLAVNAGYAFKSKEKGNQLEIGLSYLLSD